MRQTTNQLTLQSYTLTVAEGLLAGQTLTATPGCTVTVNGAAPALPYLLKVGDALVVTHKAGTGLSGLTLLAALSSDAAPGTPADPDPAQWAWTDDFNRAFLGGDYTTALSSTVSGDQNASIASSALLLGQHVLVAPQGSGGTEAKDYARARLGSARWNAADLSVQYDCAYTIAQGAYVVPPVLGARIVGANKNLLFDGTHLLWGADQLARVADPLQPGTTYRHRLTVDTALGRIQISRDSSGVVDVPLPADWASAMGGQGLVELVHETSPVPTGTNTSYSRATFDNFAVRAGSGNGQQSTGTTGTNVQLGSLWRFGVGAPDDTLGVNGDIWVDTASSSVYQRVNGAYQVQANLRGPKGNPGDPGAAGASGSGITRLSGTYAAMPFLQGNGGNSGIRNTQVGLLTLNFTTTKVLSAEGFVLSVGGATSAAIIGAAISAQDGTTLAYDVGSVVSEIEGQVSIAFKRVAYLPAGSYSLAVRFVAGTTLALTSNPILGGGATSFNIDGNVNYAPDRIYLLSGAGTTVGALDLLGMHVVTEPTPTPVWTDGAFEVVAASGAAPYLRTRSGGTDYALAFTPVSSGGGGGQDA